MFYFVCFLGLAVLRLILRLTFCPITMNNHKSCTCGPFISGSMMVLQYCIFDSSHSVFFNYASVLERCWEVKGVVVILQEAQLRIKEPGQCIQICLLVLPFQEAICMNFLKILKIAIKQLNLFYTILLIWDDVWTWERSNVCSTYNDNYCIYCIIWESYFNRNQREIDVVIMH